MSDKQKFPRADAQRVADELIRALRDFCELGYCVVAGSLRRQKEQVGDIEILFVPRIALRCPDGELFEIGEPVNLMAEGIADLCALKVLEPRRNSLGRITWGELIKLSRHVESGIPVDFFAATKENWWNYLVCRTGPAQSNVAIAKAVQAFGYKWKPYSAGFTQANDPEEKCRERVMCEADVFHFAGLEYREPKER